MSETDRDGFVRILPPLLDRWLRRCHREHVSPDEAAGVQLERALRREGSLMSEDAPPARDWREAARRLAAAYRKSNNKEVDDGT